jgi:hypothetical protein
MSQGSDDDCTDCSALASSLLSDSGETESAGFFVGLGFTF